MSTINPLLLNSQLQLNLKSTFLLLFFFFFFNSAFAKSFSAGQYFTNQAGAEQCKHLVLNQCDDSNYSTITIALSPDTSVTNDDSLIFLTGFSPYSEAENQTFTILGIESCPENTLSIFDRWGQEVYSKKGYKNEWNGMVNGNIAELGTYYYMFSDGKGKTYSGYVNIESEI